MPRLAKPASPTPGPVVKRPRGRPPKAAPSAIVEPAARDDASEFRAALAALLEVLASPPVPSVDATKTAPVAVTREDAERSMRALRSRTAEIETFRGWADRAKADLSAMTERLLSTLDARARSHRDAIEAFARDHRDELLTGDAKTAAFAGGKVTFRTSPGAIEVTDSKAALDFCRAHPAIEKAIVKVSRAIDKRAAAKDENRAKIASVPGIRWVPGREEVTVEPS